VRPRQARYQAALRPDINYSVDLKAVLNITTSQIHRVFAEKSTANPNTCSLHEVPHFPNKLTVLFARST